jgi:hypothetical protein
MAMEGMGPTRSSGLTNNDWEYDLEENASYTTAQDSMPTIIAELATPTNEDDVANRVTNDGTVETRSGSAIVGTPTMTIPSGGRQTSCHDD